MTVAVIEIAIWWLRRREPVTEATSPASDSTINEDGHVLNPRRGLLAAGLAVAVVGAMGVAWTLNAGAEEITGGTEVPAAADAAEDGAEPAPPGLLPWGDRPEPVRKGRPGANSKALRAAGLDAAANDLAGSLQPRARFAPKGRSGTKAILRTEQTTIKPPEPPLPTASASPTSDASPTPTATATDAATAAAVTPSPTATGIPPAAADSVSPAMVATANATAAKTGSTGVAPAPSSSTTGPARVFYLYNVGGQMAETDGFYVNVTIGRPALGRADYHTLAELALQSADGRQIVEVGWNVDRVVNGDDDPHLFVYRWVNRAPSCYNGCGFVQYSRNIKPGDTLAYGVGKRFGIQYAGGAWWIAFDSEWIGYFPEQLWLDAGVSFNRSGLIQTFGEVAAASERPCTQMGTGQSADTTGSAAMGSVAFLNGPEVNLNVRSTTDLYPVRPLSSRTFRYGGPGAC